MSEVEYKKEIAKITRTHLGYESHGILTIYLTVDFGGAGTIIGGYNLSIGNGGAMAKFVAGVLRATGVQTWEEVRGRTVLVLSDSDRKVVGIENLPTEDGALFLFSEMLGN